MGLDIYMRKVDDLAKMRVLEDAYQAGTNHIYDYNGRKYEDISEEERAGWEAKAKALALSLGLDEDGSYPGSEDLPEEASTLHPEHMFKLTYFRSSYNSGGINSVADARGLPGLYDIFQPPKDEYIFKPDWAACLERAAQAVAAWREAEVSDEAQYQCLEISENPYSGKGPEITQKESIAVTVAQVSKKSSFGGGWSCKDGHFYPDGIKVIGIRLGQTRSYNGQMYPTVHLIYKHEEEKGNSLTWYREAIEVVHEAIVAIMQREDREQINLVWSG